MRIAAPPLPDILPCDQPERAGSRAGNRKWHTHRNARIAALRRAAVSERRTDAVLGFVRPQAQEFNSYFCSTVDVAHAHGRRGARWADDDAAIEAMKRKVPATMTECFELVEPERSVGHGRAVHDLRPVLVHDRDLARTRPGRHDQAAARDRVPRTHASAPRGAKSRGRR